jgi:aprataxin and PNK-like factor
MVLHFFLLLVFISILISLGSKCYRKNPAHFKEYSHSDPVSTSITPKVVTTGLLIIRIFFLKLYCFNFFLDTDKTLPVCPFGATCYRKNLLHFAQYSHPFDLLNPDVDSSDEEETNQSNRKNETINDGKKRKAESEEEDDGDKTEEYDSDDVCYR